MTLQSALESLTAARGHNNVNPLMLELVKSANQVMPHEEFFSEKFDLFHHDCIHIILGRGLNNIDEAFTFGFTVGCANKSTNTEYGLNAFISQLQSCGVFTFNEEELGVMKDAIKLSLISNCTAIDRFDYQSWLNEPISHVRDAIGIEPELILACYAVEKRRLPQSEASQRLLPNEKIPCVF